MNDFIFELDNETTVVSCRIDDLQNIQEEMSVLREEINNTDPADLIHNISSIHRRLSVLEKSFYYTITDLQAHQKKVEELTQLTFHNVNTK